MNFTHQEGEGFWLETVHYTLTLLATTIEEYILLSGVSMHVNVHSNTLLFAFPKYHLLQVVNLGIVLLRRIFPSSI